MILRRIAENFRSRDWFTVVVEFLIVVVGIFVGLEVSNWNEERQQKALAQAYLVRLAEELSVMETYLEGMIAETNGRYALTVQLLQAASDQEIGEENLIDATRSFFTEGWRTPRLTILDAVFEDLSSTGNLSLIDEAIRQRITAYYADLDIRLESFRINRDWSLPNDSRLILQHDIYRWDRTFVDVLGELDEATTRQTILRARDDLARIASMFYYIETASLVHYEAALGETRELIDAIASLPGLDE